MFSSNDRPFFPSHSGNGAAPELDNLDTFAKSLKKRDRDEEEWEPWKGGPPPAHRFPPGPPPPMVSFYLVLMVSRICIRPRCGLDSICFRLRILEVVLLRRICLLGLDDLDLLLLPEIIPLLETILPVRVQETILPVMLETLETLEILETLEKAVVNPVNVKTRVIPETKNLPLMLLHNNILLLPDIPHPVKDQDQERILQAEKWTRSDPPEVKGIIKNTLSISGVVFYMT
jgi:hypothetical protein